MSIWEICFSPTGGTKKVADVVVGGLQGDATLVDLADHAADFADVVPGSDDVAVIAAPVYGGRMPATAVERLGKLNGNGARAVLVAVYGNRDFEDTLVELQDVATQAGFKPIAGIAAIAEHSLVRSIAQGRPDAQDCDTLAHFAKQIQVKLDGADTAAPDIPGNRPYKEVANPPIVPAPTDECTDCGICAAECPVQAIDADDAANVDAQACISCMRCVSVCAFDARKMADEMQAAVSGMLQQVAADRKEAQLFL